MKIMLLHLPSTNRSIAMYLRSLNIPMLDWIDDILGMPSFSQFQSTMINMVLTTIVLYKAGYFEYSQRLLNSRAS